MPQAPNIPTPITLSGGSQRQPFIEQMLLMLASQAPGLLSQHLARKDEQRQMEARAAAAMPAIEQLSAAAQADPALAPLLASIGAFQQLSPDVQMRSAPDFLAQSQELMTTLAGRAESGARTGLLQTQTRAAAAERRAAELHPGAIASQQTENELKRFELEHAQRMGPLQEQLMAAQTRAQEAAAAADFATASRMSEEARSIQQQMQLAATESAIEAERLERTGFANTFATLSNTLQGAQMDNASLRTLASMMWYGTPTPPSARELRSDLQTRLGGSDVNLFEQRRQRLIGTVQEMGFADFDAAAADALDAYLMDKMGNAQAAYDAIAGSGQLDGERLAVAAAYLSAATGQRVTPPEPPPPSLGERIRRWLQLQQAKPRQQPNLQQLLIGSTP